MKIILLNDVAKVGKRYDTKNISDGYAQNFLIPRGLAIPATEDASKRILKEKEKEEGERRLRNELLLKNIQELDHQTIVIEEKANEKGHLFAGLHKAEIIKQIEKQTRLQIDEAHIILEKPIKEIGDHIIDLKIDDKKISFTLSIKAK